MTDEPLLLPRMDTNVPMAITSGMAVLIGAECSCGVHDGPPGLCGSMPRGVCLDPHFCYK